jgi:endonuclease/exonuclease/phosphatase (EEP) superfamily protein YafD
MHLLKLLCSLLCICISLAAVLAASICVTNPHQSFFYLLDIFTLPVLSATAVITAAFYWAREKWAGHIGVLAVLIGLWAMAPQAFVSQKPADKSVPPVRLMFANLYIANKTPEHLKSWIDKEKPDIVANVENFRVAAETLTPQLKTLYPYQYRHRDTVVYSRYPIADERHGKTRYSFDQVDIKTPQGLLHVAIVHLCQPKPKDHSCQVSQMARLRTDLQPEQNARTVIVGDFNSGLSAYLLQDFAREHNFRPLAAPTGSWPALLPGIFRIAIDNAFAGSGLSLQRRKVGPDNGSDHRPFVIDIYPAKVKPSSQAS